MWLLLLIIISPFTPTVDLYISGLFYSPESGFYNNLFLHAFFIYSEWVGLAAGGMACFLFLLSFIQPKWKKFRRGSLALILTLVIGAGIITNSIFKQHWGRPRPREVIEFGGNYPYLPFWQPNFHEKHKSFPSGHVAMGFYFLSLCLVGRRYKSRLLFRTGFFFTLFLGGGLMITRVVQGGHFVSDVIVSPILMWYVAKSIDWCVFTSGVFEKRTPCSNSQGTSQELDEP